MVRSVFRIGRQTSIEAIVEHHPELIRPLRESGIVCTRCGEPIWGTLEQAALEKGIVDLDRIVEGLNRILAKKGQTAGL
jgi:hypothetical protein